MNSGTIKEWSRDILIAILVIIVLYLFLWPVKIDGVSMETSFCDGDKVVMSRVLTMTDHYNKGDILVFIGEDQGKTIKMIKRVIAVGGDHVDIRDGKVFINGEILNETYVDGPTTGELELKVPTGEIFFLGDNREKSFDSREMGTISKKALQGKVLFRWFPFQKMRFY